MKLYEINEEIGSLIDQILVDEETGEILCDIDEIYARIDALEMEKKSILEFLAKLVLNTRAEAAAVKAEEKKESRLMQILDRECAGTKTDLGVATFYYRKTTRVDVSDAEKAVNWLKRHKHTDCYRVPVPEVAKNEVKKLLAAGENVPGCAVVEDYSCLLK